MKLYDVYVQEKFYKVMEADNTGSVLAMVADDIKNNLVQDFDNTQNQNIKIVPKEVE